MHLFEKRENKHCTSVLCWVFLARFYEDSCWNNFHFPSWFSLFSKHSDNYRNKEVCVEIQYCFIQTLLAIDFFRHWNWASEFHLDFSHVFRQELYPLIFFSCFPKLLNGFKSRNHIGSCPSKAYAKKCDINYVAHWILLLKNRIKTKILF